MEDTLEWCLDSSNGESYDSFDEDLFIVNSSKFSQDVNDARKDGYNDGAISTQSTAVLVPLLVPVLLVVIHRLVMDDLCWMF